MPKADQILSLLNDRARRFQFPVIDSAHVTVLAARLRCFARGDAWAVVFEWLGFSEPELTYPLDIYGYGSLVGSEGFLLGQAAGIEPDARSPLWNDDSEWVPKDPIIIRVGQGPVVFSNRPDGGDAIRLAHGDIADEAAFGRAVVRELGVSRALPDERLFEVVPVLQDAVEVVRLVDWDHPDVTGGQTPAESSALVACARLLAGETTQLHYAHNGDVIRSWCVAGRRRLSR
jgi:hypothetical protein